MSRRALSSDVAAFVWQDAVGKSFYLKEPYEEEPTCGHEHRLVALACSLCSLSVLGPIMGAWLHRLLSRPVTAVRRLLLPSPGKSFRTRTCSTRQADMFVSTFNPVAGGVSFGVADSFLGEASFRTRER